MLIPLEQTITLDEIFYTKEHDWVRFCDTVSYIGIARFKLTGIRKIDDITLFDYKNSDKIEVGAILLNLHYKDYIIPMHAPITCTFLEINPVIKEGLWELIVKDPEGDGWLFKVAPKHRKNGYLLHPSFYQTRIPAGSTIQS